MYQMSNIHKGHTNAASLKYSRQMHACTIFGSSAHNGRPVAIVAGSEGSNTAEVWDFTIVDSLWEESMPISTILLFVLFFTDVAIIARELLLKTSRYYLQLTAILIE